MLSKLSNKKLFILTCKDYPLGNAALQGLLERLGAFYEAKFCVWQELKNLDKNCLILPLAVWDYSLFYEEFLAFLQECEKSGAKMLNAYDLIKTNSQKNYLQNLQEKGFDIAKSLFLKKEQKALWQEQILKFKKDFKLKELIIKPLIGQSGRGVLRFESPDLLDLSKLEQGLVQEFLEGVYEGEFCLIFFNNQFSHAIKRELKDKEYRANSAYGVQILPFSPSKALIQKALGAIKALSLKSTLYARVDFIKDNENFIINEVELIEPSLYFDKGVNSYENFIKALENLS
ncbi:RimK family alpha-L-glutamate ligase [Campylobacter sp. MIT 99-7217]|uniref:ATP-grasp domain-containing protein n=1 Tax=Campylobacter sp. MIT 99-7217 TaxID=535091 RepID=UPI00163D38FA|nr:hypothetical protein [Campylobacter sp. MIT 99-7217]